MRIKLIIIDAEDAPIYIDPPEYFIDTEVYSHIDVWRYSAVSSPRIIETVFL
jgi:hypothetical protein